MKTKFFLTVFILLTPSLWAMGPRDVTTSGIPVKWSGGAVNVDIETDQTVGSKDVSALITEALDAWDNLTEADVTITRRSLGDDVDNSNVCDYLYDSSECTTNSVLTNGLNPLIIDEDGSIVARYFGTGNRYGTLGFASIAASNATTGAAIKGGAVFNAACLADQEVSTTGCSTAGVSGTGFSDDDFTSFMVHELGHFLGLDHSQINLTESESSTTSDNDVIGTMFPLFIQGNGANFKTPEKDDIAGLALLYPSSSFTSSTWEIQGVLYSTDGTTGVQCGNIVARNSTSHSTTDAVSALSGDLAQDGVTDGTFRIVGLTPESVYSLDVESIPVRSARIYLGASGYTPCRGSGNSEPSPPQFTKFTSTTTFTGTATQTIYVSCTRTSTGGDCVQTTSLGGNGASGSGGSGGTGGSAESSSSGGSCSLIQY